MEGLQTTAPESSIAADQQFHLVANSVAKLLETAKRELERDQEAAKASLVTASHILKRRSNVVRALTAPQGVVWPLGRSFECELTLTITCIAPFTSGISVLSPVEARRTSHVSSNWLLAVAACLRGEKASGRKPPPDDDQCGTAERNSLERGLFGSSTSMQALQTGLWSKSGQLATRARKPWRGRLKNRHGREHAASDQRGKVLSFGPLAGLRVHMGSFGRRWGSVNLAADISQASRDGLARSSVLSSVSNSTQASASLRGDKAKGLRA